MITSEERYPECGRSWYHHLPICAGMHQSEPKRRIFSEEESIPFHEYLNIEVQEDPELGKRNEKVMGTAHDMHHPHPPDAYQIPDFIKVELNETDNQTEPETRLYPEEAPRGSETDSTNYTWRHLQNMTPNVEFLSHLTATPATVIRTIKKEKQNGKTKGNRLSLRLQLTPWESERLFKRREQNRKRKALQRAQETEEQRNARREKERLAKAALRASESIEKRLVRRERDRIAKAISRAVETEEQRRIRREKNRMAMAALRAAQTEEERIIRREKDRIKKAALRAFETEEQKKVRREKNRIAMAIRRANRSGQERNYLKNVNPIQKPSFRSSCLIPADKAAGRTPSRGDVENVAAT
ncbi:hypothetical protein RUM44_002146 [Polyplax serrata]|uniref:Uncharacterized protein n=1 Tax=Polyplax serrata TaxID=468196 RepID=A0ABR1AM12_POLSC